MVRNAVLMVCGAFWVASLTPAPAYAAAIIELRPEAEIASRTYGLADISALDKVDGDMRRRLSQVVIGRTPRPGQLAQISRFELNAILEQKMPRLSEHLQWSGASLVRVRGAGVSCDVEALGQKAYRHLQSRLERDFDNVSIEMVSRPESLIVPTGEVTFHPRLSPAVRLKRRMPVMVDVKVDGGHFQTLPVWFAVSVHEPVLVMKAATAKGQQVSSRDVIREVREVTGFAGQPVKMEQLNGLRLVRDLAAGQELTVDDVEAEPPVSRGDLITVVARHGGVSVSVRGLAMADGNVEQSIEVRSPSSGESYRAKVIGKSLAMVN